MGETIQPQTPVLKFVDNNAPPINFKEARAEYIGNGGQLDPESFQFIKKFLPSPKIEEMLSRKPYQANIYQAAGLEKHSGISLSEQEKNLYALLRSQPPKEDLPEITGNRPQTMSDQVLMAEILRLTSPEKMTEFMSKYPNIFPEQIIKYDQSSNNLTTKENLYISPILNLKRRVVGG